MRERLGGLVPGTDIVYFIILTPCFVSGDGSPKDCNLYYPQSFAVHNIQNIGKIFFLNVHRLYSLNRIQATIYKCLLTIFSNVTATYKFPYSPQQNELWCRFCSNAFTIFNLQNHYQSSFPAIANYNPETIASYVSKLCLQYNLRSHCKLEPFKILTSYNFQNDCCNLWFQNTESIDTFQT